MSWTADRKAKAAEVATAKAAMEKRKAAMRGEMLLLLNPPPLVHNTVSLPLPQPLK
jgi:hypothetical protein